MAQAGKLKWQLLKGNCTWLNQEHELILTVNIHALKRVIHSAENSVYWTGGKALDIPIGNSVLLHDYPGHNKIKGNYKSELFVMETNHKDPNVYNIKLLNGKGPVCTVNWEQIFIFISHRWILVHVINPPDIYYTYQENLWKSNSPNWSSLWYQIQDQNTLNSIRFLLWSWGKL